MDREEAFWEVINTMTIEQFESFLSAIRMWVGVKKVKEEC